MCKIVFELSHTISTVLYISHLFKFSYQKCTWWKKVILPKSQCKQSTSNKKAGKGTCGHEDYTSQADPNSSEYPPNPTPFATFFSQSNSSSFQLTSLSSTLHHPTMPIFTASLMGSASGLTFLPHLSDNSSSLSPLTNPPSNFPKFCRNYFPLKRPSLCIPKVSVEQAAAAAGAVEDSPDDVKQSRVCFLSHLFSLLACWEFHF